MSNVIHVTGRLVDPRNIELDDPVKDIMPGTSVIVKLASPSPIAEPAETFEEFVAWIEALPVSGRSREDIEQQVREEREAWGEG